MMQKMVRIWLLSIAVLTLGMVAFGGLVRLTESGLSMVDWHPVTGWMPPLNQPAWDQEFLKYQNSPQFIQVNAHMTVDQFKFIYLMEYGHRVLGRILFLVLLCWGAYFASKKQLKGSLRAQWLSLVMLILVQGFAGWFMVKSGLVDIPRVSHYRLTIHLLLALLTFVFCLWHAFPSVYHKPFLKCRKPLMMLAGGLLIQMVLGGFLAGTRGAYTFNTFPLMGGQFMPSALWSQSPFMLNFLENPSTINFMHRWFGTILWIWGSLWLFKFWPQSQGSVFLRRALVVFASLLSVQFVLGVFTIVYYVPVSLASIHQVNAFVLLGVTTILIRQSMDN